MDFVNLISVIDVIYLDEMEDGNRLVLNSIRLLINLRIYVFIR